MSTVAYVPRSLTAATGLSDALGALVGTEGAGLPVLDGRDDGLVGWITHQSVLAAMHRATRRPDG
ncbi:CBS domain-containing protein [Actinacidiphila epipremni]|uniref:CBS domain-containing protein n=1 Tax=Actinacidiphila epipremni TaxID=2053013 RepID=A0ABX0ZZ35_9ACTN|nr:CBS domain-containing protein [Actinacidiphila epipremni]NJP48471.1 CBS domain-containing protein [Actinacidiphila epipremni]